MKRLVTTIGLLFGLLVSSESYAACNQTLSPGANVASAIVSAAAGSTICLNAGSYGSFQVLNVNKSPRVTLQSVSGRTATVSVDFYNGSGVDLKSLTVSSLQIRNGSRDITASGNTFTGQTVINMGGNGGNYGNANILFDGNTFDGISVCDQCYEGRIQVISELPCGVTIRNNHIGAAGESDGIQVGANGLVIGPGNVFDGIRQLNYGRHVDSIQLYGSSNTTITGNYFVNNDVIIMAPDGGRNEIITHNVFIGNGAYRPSIQFGSHIGDQFIHNTVKDISVHFDKKSDSTVKSADAIVRNNIMINAEFSTSGNCTNCLFERNLFSSSGLAMGTNNLIGMPTFVGGASPVTWAGYQLTSSSLGYRAATDGQDLGTNVYGAGTQPTPTPTPVPGLGAPTNLRLVSVSDASVSIQWSSGGGQSGFYVHRKTGSTGTYARIDSVPATALTYTDSSVAPRTTYVYRVQAYDAASTADSNELSVTTASTSLPPPSEGETLLGTSSPASTGHRDGVEYELGMKFTSIASGQIKAIRFYKSPSEFGSHTGKIYSAGGQLLASVVFSSETSSGWQEQALSTPLSIAANTVYVVSVNTGNQYYVATVNGMSSQIVSGNLRSVVGNNGVFGSVGSMPTSSWNDSNYFRDVVFVANTTTPPPGDSKAPVASVTSPTNGSTIPQNTVITLQANASDDVGVTKVEFYVYGNLKCTDTVAPYSCNWRVPKRAGKIFKIHVKAYDASGNMGKSEIVQVTSK